MSRTMIDTNKISNINETKEAVSKFESASVAFPEDAGIAANLKKLRKQLAQLEAEADDAK